MNLGSCRRNMARSVHQALAGGDATSHILPLTRSGHSHQLKVPGPGQTQICSQRNNQKALHVSRATFHHGEKHRDAQRSTTSATARDSRFPMSHSSGLFPLHPQSDERQFRECSTASARVITAGANFSAWYHETISSLPSRGMLRAGAWILRGADRCYR